MKSRFMTQRAAHAPWEDQQVGEFKRHRPYTFAISVHAGEVVTFSLGIRERVETNESGNDDSDH